MAGATDPEVYDAIFGSGALGYSWWQDVRVVVGHSDAYGEVPDGWVRIVVADDPDDPDFSVRKEVSARDIRSACRKMMHDDTVNRGLRRECSHLLFDAEELDMDADDADCVLQWVMFDGEIVYG